MLRLFLDLPLPVGTQLLTRFPFLPFLVPMAL